MKGSCFLPKKLSLNDSVGNDSAISRSKTEDSLDQSFLKIFGNDGAPAVNSEGVKTSKGMARSKKGRSCCISEVVTGY